MCVNACVRACVRVWGCLWGCFMHIVLCSTWGLGLLLFCNSWLLGFSHFSVGEKKRKVTGCGRMEVVVIKVITTVNSNVQPFFSFFFFLSAWNLFIKALVIEDQSVPF